MPPIQGVDTSLQVRPPRQRRTSEQWLRILDAGVRLLEDQGYDGFTIPALCERAGVPPRALYARADSKDALFLAVYEHGMQRILADHAVFRDSGVWAGLDDHELVARAVGAVVRIFGDHRDLLRAVVLISGAHPEVARRGEAYRRELGALFGAVLEPLDRASTHPSPEAARSFAFSVVFSTLVVGTAYGPGFGSDDVPELTRVVERSLLG